MRRHVLEMKDIIKDFPGTRALNHVCITLEEGEVLALCGENGAGKSTLMKVLSGVYPYGTYEGQIFLNGKEMKMSQIKDSEHAGIAIIHQEFALVEEMTVAENIFIGSEIAKHGIVQSQEMNKRAKELLDAFDLAINPSIKVKELGVGHKQLVEIAKALSKNANILIMDEPTAPLTEVEVEVLKKIIKKLVDKKVSCIYISHKLNEIMEICDRVTVLRDGETVGGALVKDLTTDEIIKMMVGRDLTNLYSREKHTIGAPVLEVKNYSVYRSSDGKKVVDNVSFTLHEGEVLGIAGLVGAGRTELVSSIFGSYKGRSEGEIVFQGRPYKAKNSVQAIRQGIAMVPEDRKEEGIFGIMSIRFNTSISNISQYSGKAGKINDSKELADVMRQIGALKVKMATQNDPINSLSGGNQQKVVIAKNLLVHPKVLILDEPTRGIDVGAKWEIYKLMNELTDQGIAIILVSSELPEIIGNSDRILVLQEGKLKGCLVNEKIGQVTEEDIMMQALGGR